MILATPKDMKDTKPAMATRALVMENVASAVGRMR